jgi:tRNA pseudouridine synthase 10
MDRTSQITKEVARRIKRYQFDSLAVGVSMPEGVQDREDELRANLKLKGSETIKTHAARLIAESVASKLGKRVDKTRPDLTVVVDMGSGVVTVSSKALFLYGWYTKPPGVSQKRELCGYCSGQGCEKCRATGYNQGPSVEGQLRIKLAKVSGSDRMKFTWMGNEDRESRVYPPGRPFVVELKSPVKRQVPMKFRVRSKEGPVSVSKGKMLPSRPIGLPAFRFKTEITAIAAKEVEAENLAEACRRFKRAVVRFDRPHERPVQKMVYGVQMKKRGKTLLINAELDGGLPVKRFVSGELVSPSVSEILKTEVRCRKFDIREVKEMGKLEFGKVTRL